MTVAPANSKTDPVKARLPEEVRRCLGICVNDHGWRTWLQRSPTHALGWAITAIDCPDCRHAVAEQYQAESIRVVRILDEGRKTKRLAALLGAVHELLGQVDHPTLIFHRKEVGKILADAVRILNQSQNEYNALFRPRWERGDTN